MKKTIILIVVAVVAILLVSKYSDTKNTPKNVEIMQTVPKPDASNATFTFEDGPITLKKGEATTGDGIASLETTLTDNLAYGDINNDGKNDTVVLLLQSGGGSGIFVYLAAYVSGNVEYKGSNAVFIGDRISPKDIKISSSGIITLNYLDRKEDEPMAAEPTINTSKTFIYKAGKLEER